jgi:hypothetical protein
MKVELIPRYRTPYGEIEFIPEAAVPGHSHRVAVNGQLQRLWVPTSMRPDRQSTVICLVRIWRALEEGKERHYYVDRNEDPPLPIAAPSGGVISLEAGHEPATR